ncbi:MotA/TolQ/ExbB proton channel family protein [Acidiferrobacter sp.]|jgi:biopolymer transport protein ExbB|uniref:MotA/TolQ/ExbB proton channel family protein n=1 Tax=Acidiferrobacter sp. TaxID=1872107 RepID=UPI00260D1D04|nr:MotA/TolQ/ExbB proton channel family protein [Acidiferrobacter sp.]
MTIHYLIHLANYSDGVLYLMVVILTIALAVIIDRSWYLRRTLLEGNSLVERLGALKEATRAQLSGLAATAPNLPEAVLLDVAARHMGVTNGEQLANRLDEATLRLAPALDKRLWILDTVVTLAPLLGLFGTIVGMFHAFSVLSAPGHAPTAVTGGIADALVATASGLFVAMTGLLAFNGLNNKVRVVLHQLDIVKTMLLNRMDGAPVNIVSDGEPVVDHGAARARMAKSS